MALTQSITESHPINLGALQGKVIRLDVTEYAAGGFNAGNSDLGLEGSSQPWFLSIVAEEDALFFQHDIANDKILAFNETAEMGAVDIGVIRLVAITPSPMQ